MYNNIRKKVNKFYQGGKIPKYAIPAGPLTPTQQETLTKIMEKTGLDEQAAKNRMDELGLFGEAPTAATETITSATPNVSNILNSGLSAVSAGLKIDEKDQMSNDRAMTKVASAFGVDSSFVGSGKGQMSSESAMGTGIATQLGSAAVQALDEGLMGDKNFGAQSAAIDSTVHATSKALMSSGNPYMLIAGAALEGANFLTKAGGQTVQGFDVDINNSGYGTLGHMDSTSSRDFGAAIGLGGLNFNKMQRKLERRNEQAKMALTAAEISGDQSFEQEARMNSVENTIMQNQQALAGGIDTTLLGS